MFKEAWQIYARAAKIRKEGLKAYLGNAKQICEQILQNCWNGTHFVISTGHFKQFWTRDFGMNAGALVRLGYKDEVRKTLQYALNIFSNHKSVGTTILSKKKIISFPTYSPDSLAFLLHSIRLARLKVTEKDKEFLENSVADFIERVVDKETGLVRKNTHFSSMKDYYIRNSSCYDNIMAALVAREAKALHLKCEYEFPYKAFIETFWKGNYFLDDLSSHEYVAGDANVFPFWSGIVKSRSMLKSALTAIKQEGLDRPFPLKYTAKPAPQRRISMGFFVPNYAGNTIWTHLGGCYLQVLQKANKAEFKASIGRYKEMIEKHKNFLEVFNPDGTPYKSRFYFSDDSMLWAANYLAALQ